MQKGSEEEKKSGDYQKKTSHLRGRTWRRCKDASSWNKVTNVKVQKKTKETSKKEEKKVVSQGPSPPPRPSYWQGWQRSHDAPLSLTVKPTSNGQGAVPVKASQKVQRKKRWKKKKKKQRQRRTRGELVTYVPFHLALSKQAYSVCTQALRDVSFKGEGKKGGRQDKESDIQTRIQWLVLSSRGRCSAYVYVNLYFTLEMKARLGGGLEGGKKCGGLWWRELWSEIKHAAPLQRMSSHLCDVKSKLINKGSRFQGVLSRIQGAEASHFHQLKSPHMSKLLLSRRATFLVLMPLIIIYHFVSNQKGLAGSRRALHSHNQSPFQIFAPVWKSKKLRLL